MFVDLAAASLDVFVGKREQRRRHFEGERLYTEFEQPTKYEPVINLKTARTTQRKNRLQGSPDDTPHQKRIGESPSERCGELLGS
jgi:hypothetical protein